MLKRKVETYVRDRGIVVDTGMEGLGAGRNRAVVATLLQDGAEIASIASSKTTKVSDFDRELGSFNEGARKVAGQSSADLFAKA
jgi:hypothetical protein